MMDFIRAAKKKALEKMMGSMGDMSMEEMGKPAVTITVGSEEGMPETGQPPVDDEMAAANEISPEFGEYLMKRRRMAGGR